MVLTGGNFIPVTCWPAGLSAVGLLASWIITVEEWFFWLMEMKFERRGEVVNRVRLMVNQMSCGWLRDGLDTVSS